MSHEIIIISRAVQIETGHGNMNIKKSARASIADVLAVCKHIWAYLRQ